MKDFNSKYTGVEVEDILDSVKDKASQEDFNLAIERIDDLASEKQDEITDLDTIRAGAAKGATALQSYTEKYTGTITGIKMNGASKGTSGVVDLGTVITAHQDISGKADSSSLAKVATSGSYNDLSNKPIIPTNVSQLNDDIGLVDKQFARENFIGISDVSSELKIARIDQFMTPYGSLLYAFPDTANGDEDDVLLSCNTVKTINGESIVGSGNITIDSGEGGGSSSGSGAYAEVNHGTSDTTFALTPNTFHVWDEVASLTLTLGSETAGVANEFLFQFTSGATATTLSLPSDLKWTDELVIEPNMIYQVSILKGLASVLSWSDSIELKDNFIDIQENELVFQYPTTSELSISVYGRTTGMPTNHEIVVPSGSSSYVASNLSTILYIDSVSPSSDSTYNYTFQIS